MTHLMDKMDPVVDRERQYYLVLYRELKKMFGPPPVLSSEPLAGYNNMLFRLLEAIRPRDFYERTLVKQLADANWEITRYGRLKTEYIQEKFREMTELEQHARPPAEHAANAQQPGTAEGSQTSERMSAARGSDPGAGATNQGQGAPAKSATFSDHARAFGEGIDQVERIEKLLKAALARRNNARAEMERYRENLAGSAPINWNGLMAFEFRSAGIKDPLLSWLEQERVESNEASAESSPESLSGSSSPVRHETQIAQNGADGSPGEEPNSAGGVAKPLAGSGDGGSNDLR